MTERDTPDVRHTGFGESTTAAAGLPGTQPAPLTPEAASQPATAGTMLRQLRESAGVDTALLASAMKVSLQKLEALEADRLDLLPDVTFARGLASAICRAFGVDPAPVLERMPVSAPGLRPTGQKSINQPFRRTGDGPTPMLASSFSKPLLYAVGALLLGAAALWLLPTLPIQLGAPANGNAPAADGVVSEPVTPFAATEPPTSAEMPEGAAVAEQPLPTASAPALAASAAASVPAAAAAAAAAAAPRGTIVFTATGETWVTVRDAGGAALLNRALNAGDAVGVSGTPPLSVTIGRKDAVTVTVHGKPFDHRSLSRTPVSRFQVD
ncbi:MAG: helix-turn-helix domain-containing protein [Pseudomonadota bacterium]|nr:helix-turn-helix domain-containing protein [Pseudomonadota bacterium]